jgi:hypothetical protein
MPISVWVTDPHVPRKFIAFREVGHIRLKWFAPELTDDVRRYEIYRSDGFEKPAVLLAKVTGTEYIDENVVKDRAYYYHVVAVNKAGHRSRPSNEDNAKALSKPRFYDAEIIAHTLPTEMRAGDHVTATITLRNTGSKPWDITRSQKDLWFNFGCTQQWGSMDEGQLPRMALPGSKPIRPGETVTITVPYTAPRPGRFENHWILCMDIVGKGRAYIGTPLLVETTVLTKS